MSLYSGGIYHQPAAAVPVWTVLADLDFTTEGSADWTGNGSKSAAGITWTVTNGGKCSTLGPDGSTGIRMVQTTSGTLGAGTSPQFVASMASFGSVADGDVLLVEWEWSGIASGGDFARLVAVIDEGGDYIASGVMYRTSPGQWEMGSISGSSQWTDPSVAVADSTEALVQTLFSAAGVRSHDRGSYTGSYPDPTAASLSDAVGTPSASGRTDISPRLSDSTLGFATFRTGGTTNITIHRMRVSKRSP